MDTQQIINVTLLVWGGLFCLIGTLYFAMMRDYDRERCKWMVAMQLSTALLLFNDGMAYVFKNGADQVHFWAVHISNFMVFLMVVLTLLFFHRYACATLMTAEERARSRRVKAVNWVCLIGVMLIAFSQFTGLYYYFDAQNVYHRSAYYPISVVIPMVGMFLDASLLLQYRSRISCKMFLAIGSYIVFPLISIAIQINHYGWSLIDLSISAAMILMLLVSASEQNETLRALERSRIQMAEKLEIATMLNHCVEKLSGQQDLDAATNELLGVINDYFKADRSYIFEIDPSGKYVVNTHEFVRSGVVAEKDNLQRVPLSVVADWMKHFETHDVYAIRSLEDELGTPAHDVLKVQDVRQLLAVPLRSSKKGKIIGFLGVDNPTEHFDDPTLLSSIQFFVTSSLERQRLQENLTHLSYTDMLTQLSNRNRYIERLNRWRGMHLEQMGCIYMDLNGLKHCNDSRGHAAGDVLIRRAADALNEVFPGQAYRIGGDEFVVLLCPIGQELFERKVEQLRAALVHHQVGAAVGSVWHTAVEDVDTLLQEADEQMYEEKVRTKETR